MRVGVYIGLDIGVNLNNEVHAFSQGYQHPEEIRHFVQQRGDVDLWVNQGKLPEFQLRVILKYYIYVRKNTKASWTNDNRKSAELLVMPSHFSPSEETLLSRHLMQLRIMLIGVLSSWLTEANIMSWYCCIAFSLYSYFSEEMSLKMMRIYSLEPFRKLALEPKLTLWVIFIILSETIFWIAEKFSFELKGLISTSFSKKFYAPPIFLRSIW